MMKYLTRPAKPEYEQVAMAGPIKGGKKLIEKLIKKGDVKKGEAPKTDVEKVKSKVESDQKNIQELADNNQIAVKSDIPEPFAGKFEEEFTAHDNMFGRRSGDNKVDAQEIAEQVAEARGQDYYDLGYKEQMDLYDKAYNYLGLLDRTKIAMKEAKTSSKLGDLKSPYKFTGDETLDDPGMFDDIFNKMYPDYSEGGKYELPLPGEEPLTPIKKKRTLNAEGGVIGGGMIEGEDLGDRTGFKEPKTSIRRGVVEDYSKPGSSIPAIRQIKKGENEGKWAYRKSGKITGYYNSEKEAKEAQKKAIEAQYEGAKKPFSEKEIREVKKLRSEGKTIEQIAKESGIDSRQRVVNILRSEGLTSKRGGSSKYLEDKDNLKYVQENYKKLKRSTIGENLFPDVSPSVAYDRAGRLISKLSDEGKIDTSGTKFSEEYIEEAGLKKVPKKEQDRLKGRKRYQREKAVGGKGYKDHLIKFKKEVAEVLGIPKIERKTSALTSSDFTPIDMAHRTDMDFLKLIKDPIRAEDFGPDFYNLNRKTIKKLENKLEPLYLEQSKLLKKAKKLDRVPKELQTQINNNNIKILNSFEDFPQIANRIKPITINPKNLNIYRGVQDVTKELGVGMVDKAMKDIKVGSQEDFIIKANLAEQIKSEALESGLLKNKKLADKKLNKFFKTKRIEGPKLKSVVIPGAQSFADFTSSIIDDIAKGAYGKAALKKLGLLGTYFGGKDAVKTLAKGESGTEAVADFLGLKGIIQDQMETMSLTPDARGIKQRTAREQFQKNLQESGFMGGGLDQSGIASLYPTEPDQPVTEAEARQLQTEQNIYRSKKEGIEQLRRQAGDIQLQEFMSKFGIPYDPDREYAFGGRVGFEKGGSSSDKKKTTPALDKPTIQIDPNAPVDPDRRDFMEKGAGIGVGLGALATGLVKFAPEIKKAATKATTVIENEVPEIIKQLYFTIRNRGKTTDYGGNGVVKTKLGPYTLEEGPGGYNITKMTDSDFRYQQEYFEVITDPEKGVIHYEELTALPDIDGKLKDVDYGVDLDTYREIGEDLAKIKNDDSLIKIANDDIAKQIEKEEAFKKSLQKKGTGEND